ncbi:MAG: site-specific integrase [Campylobacterota bacterium]|nr:site-specific integrase [Campylobacterota bacterium]
MAISEEEFIQKIDIGLKATKDYKKFLYRFKIADKSYRRIFDYLDKNWDKKTRISKAKSDAYNFKEEKKNGSANISIDENIKLHKFTVQYFEMREDSISYSGNKWSGELQSYYKRYIKNEIGNIQIKDIRQVHVKRIIQKVKALGFSARTQKITLELLNPIFKSAIANRVIVHNPCDGITITRPKTKKKVQNASLLLKEVYDAIMKIFKDDIYFQALFLFALQGRRKSEILTLKWKNIDFKNKQYTLPMTKNGEEQTFLLPDSIALLLLKMKSNKDHYVFESPTNSIKHIQNIKAQTNKLKKELNNPNFGIHYLRNVVVSAMAEQGINSNLLSGALGHSDLHTMKKYVNVNYLQGSTEANKTIEAITKQN